MTERDGQERIAKLLAHRGLCSRREAERLVIAGLVSVDGAIVQDPGRRVNVDANLQVLEKGQTRLERRVTVLLHKPRGIVSTQPEGDQVPAWTLLTPGRCADAEPDPTVLAEPWHCAVCGRLDQDSRGLLVLSQDGVLARVITGTHTWKKYYLVTVDNDPQPHQINALRRLNTLDGKPLQPMRVDLVGERQLRFILREGRKRQIRRTCDMVGLNVVDLLRDRIGPWSLGDLAEGQWQVVPREDVERVISAAGPAPDPHQYE